MQLDPHAIKYAVEKTTISARQVASVCELLFMQDCTIPFIARYRKEATGALDEVQLRDIQEAYNESIEMEKRRKYILETIEQMGKLTPQLKEQILKAKELAQLEDLYAPYKSKKKTKAMMAEDRGLAPLADLLLNSTTKISETPELKAQFLPGALKDLKSWKEALEGAYDILVDRFSHNPATKERLREIYHNQALVVSSLRKDGDKIKEASKFKDYFEYSAPVKELALAKNGHRFLALRRAMTLKILKVSIEINPEDGYQLIEANDFPNTQVRGNHELLKQLAKRAFDAVLAPSLDLEIKSHLKTLADTEAINVFGVNLKNLLLRPYLGAKAVLGIDPGIRTGCKVVVIDHTGKYLGDHVIYPFAPKNDIKGSTLVIEKLLEAFSIEHIAIGNGTNGRETLDFLEEHVQLVKEGKVHATLISEAGASIYSASDIAREEFPDKDVTVRGAISIARRFQDPLAELVKIDPKSIGVGQYQHDVNQSKLKKSLGHVVEDCVNFVGVDLNTASAPLLSFISGVGPSVAKNIVKHREKLGGLNCREELLNVPRLSPKIFEQCAGFMRIYNGQNPLDATFIHPEQYSHLADWAKKQNVALKDLLNDQDLVKKLESDKELANIIGHMTYQDIIQGLKAPSQDPRVEFKSTDFGKKVRKLEDLTQGQWYTGVVENITNFGAFIDLGLKESGLLHISQMADRFVENPMDIFKVGEEIKVRVTDIDFERGRISLSAKQDDSGQNAGAFENKKERRSKSHSSRPAAKAPQQKAKIKNNAFASLANIKIK